MSVVHIHRGKKEPAGAAGGTRNILDSLIEALAVAAANEEHKKLMPVDHSPDRKNGRDQRARAQR